MKKVITAVGWAVLCAAPVQAQYDIGSVAGQLTPLETTRPWSLSLAVRGFYDDNYLTLPKTYDYINPNTGTAVTGHPISSWGTEVSPAVAVNHTAENTAVSASYVYDMQWYAQPPVNQSDALDQTHQFNGSLQHEFSDRYKLALTESFVVAQEPDVLTPSAGALGGVTATPLRVSGNNVRNYGQIDFTASLTKLLDLHLGYGNTVYAYQQIDRSVIGYPFGVNGINAGYPPVPSYSDLLDRMEQLATVDLRWKFTPETTGVLGYQYGHTDYTSPGYIIYPGPYPPTAASTGGFRSDIRNSDSHFGFLGADMSFTPELNGSIRAGAEYIDYYNYGTSQVSPYVDASLTYQYLPGCSAQLGVKHVHNSTDVAGELGDNGNGTTAPVLDEESTAVYISDSHKLSDRFTATVMGQAQNSTFVGGGSGPTGFDGKTENFFILQLNLAYHFNPWLVAEGGYNYSKLNSELLERSYTRDVVYLGLRATY